MADLVVDSSVAIKWFFVEPYSAEARRLLAGYQAGALSFVSVQVGMVSCGEL